MYKKINEAVEILVKTITDLAKQEIAKIEPAVAERLFNGNDNIQCAEIMTVKEQLKVHEGIRLKVYKCPAGKLTIGYGRNLEDNGISEQEACLLLDSDIYKCVEQLRKHIPKIYDNLTANRKAVLINMCFNLGINGLLGFKQTLAFIEAGEYEKAANAMLASKWAKQVGNRALQLSELMRKG